MPASNYFNHDVTHWPVTGPDGYGGFLFGTPVELRGRWGDKNELFLTEDSEEVVSKAIVYLGVDVDVGDYFAQGKLKATADPTTLTSPDRAYRSRQYNKTTDLRNLTALRKVFL